MFDIKISPKKIALILFLVVLFLTAASLIGQYYKTFPGIDPFWLKVINKLDLDLEDNNLPTWYQSGTLLLSAFLLTIIALVKKAERNMDFRYWAVLAIAFLYLSLDETVAIHEQLTLPLRHSFDLNGFFYLSWVIPAGIFLLFFAVLNLKFLFRLPPLTRTLMIVAGAIYILGAVGIEMIGGKYLSATNNVPILVQDWNYVLLTTLEEFLEMFGIVIFIYTILSYLLAEIPAILERGQAAETSSGE
jgi:hypothetical protein